ncbi:MAG: sugar phosphate nucleotidyltransferase [Desulfurivibrio sp.]|nr:sugar phosphate nucleotidyltransferase [Desulfurivibrio sp.]
MAITPVILCGGAGSRLWPVSRALYPKPFIRLTDGQSLL